MTFIITVAICTLYSKIEFVIFSGCNVYSFIWFELFNVKTKLFNVSLSFESEIISNLTLAKSNIFDTSMSSVIESLNI